MSSPHDLSGVHVALTVPFDLMSGRVDHEALEQHCEWLIGRGIAGLVPNSPLGEYESLDRDERMAVVETVARTVAGRAKVIVNVSAPSWIAAGDHTQHAAVVGADAVMLLPPTNHRPTMRELYDHYRSVASYDLPVVIANGPASAPHDLTPAIIAELAEIEGVAAVSESSGDVRRISAIIERAPMIQVLCGADDLALESALMGATGWIGGFTGALPEATVRLFALAGSGDLAQALALYRSLLPLMRWGSGPRFVEAVKFTIERVGGHAGGLPRPPRHGLSEDERADVVRQLQLARSVGGA